ncbi:sensor histidine kinase [Paenibacillus sp. PAMC21692]|jgi:two-component system sensor histidine kinase YesM|uniref:cache domain-containing sensor histidine kinase n=1 Tax=Paenibacillus sp. PAMC21692 TaxID=2762320 RepID=UPI00164DD07D|nr:sensor histidine kinase [Paenibacillus sp. PAMC21692]QNK60261.1 sensor histidine kinase [Paenibacillus sp. PAMC21692]
MRHWRDVIQFRDWNLDKKLFSVYALMIIIPVIVVTMLGFQRYHENLTERVGEYGLNLTDQIGLNLDNYIRQIDRLSMTFYLDGIDGLTENKDPMHVYTEKIAVDKALRNMMLIIPFQDIEGIYWIRDKEVQYSQYGSGQQVNHDDFAADGWFDRVIAADGGGVIIPPYRPLTGNNEKGDYIFSYARSIVNVSTRNPHGILLIDVSMEFLHELLTETRMPSSPNLFIVDQNGEIIYHEDEDQMNQPFEPQLAGPYGRFVDYIHGEETMVQFVRSDTTGWSVVNTVPVKQLSDELRLMRNLLWTFTVVAVLLALSLSSVLTRWIIEPLKRMKRSMLRVELGDYDVRVQVKAQDEIGQLGRSFNMMVEQIHSLVNRELAMRIYKQQAEFKLLRSQVNPHFLFNTLESINMKAELNEDYEVADMVTKLGKLFRLSLQQNEELTSVSRELEYTRVYMQLQQIRFPKMEFVIDFPEELLDAFTLPWMLQPLVENAIIHAIAPLGGVGKVTVLGRQEAGQLVIEVLDTGEGISERRLAEIRELLYDGTQENSHEREQHIGLQNVHRRIQAYWGKEYGLDIRKGDSGGTVVTLKMKYW